MKRRGAWRGSSAGKGQSASRGMGGRRRRRGRASLVTLNTEDRARMRKLRSQKKETTGKIVFKWNYTIVVTKMQLIEVSILLFSLICGIFMHTINCSDINYIKLVMKCNN